MTSSAYNGPYRLSFFILFLMIVVSAGGTFFPSLYRDSANIKAAWFGNDIVTLFVVCPALAFALYHAKKGSIKAQLFWMGILSYTLYNFAFYLFGAVFNALFLLYVALFTASIYALIFGLFNLDKGSIRNTVNHKLHLKAVSVLLLLIALPLAVFELSQCVVAMMQGKAPAVPPLIFALDLSFVITTIFLSLVLLWKKNVWGFVLAVMMLVKGILYGLVLVAGTASVAKFSFAGKWDPLLPYYVFVILASKTGCYLMLKNLQEKKTVAAPKKEVIESSYSG